MQPAVRRVEFSAASILNGLNQGLGSIAHVVLKVRVAIEIVVAGRIGCQVTDVTIYQRQVARRYHSDV